MKSILIAEDNRNLALLYQQELLDEGYQVEVVHDGRQAIESVDRKPPDLLILDIRMPGMDGIEAMHHILAQNQHLPVILNTGYSTLKENYLTWIADACVVKSSDLSELKCAVRQVLNGGGAEC